MKSEDFEKKLPTRVELARAILTECNCVQNRPLHNDIQHANASSGDLVIGYLNNIVPEASPVGVDTWNNTTYKHFSALEKSQSPELSAILALYNNCEDECHGNAEVSAPFSSDPCNATDFPHPAEDIEFVVDDVPLPSKESAVEDVAFAPVACSDDSCNHFQVGCLVIIFSQHVAFKQSMLCTDSSFSWVIFFNFAQPIVVVRCSFGFAVRMSFKHKRFKPLGYQRASIVGELNPDRDILFLPQGVGVYLYTNAELSANVKSLQSSGTKIMMFEKTDTIPGSIFLNASQPLPPPPEPFLSPKSLSAALFINFCFISMFLLIVSLQVTAGLLQNLRTLLLVAGDVESNPGPIGKKFYVMHIIDLAYVLLAYAFY